MSHTTNNMVKLHKALYNFKASYNSALSFKEGELFVELSDSELKQDRNWYFVARTDGSAGYVPRNYVTQTSLSTAETVAHIDEVLSNLNHNVTVSVADKNEVGEKLEELKKTLSVSITYSVSCLAFF